MATPKFKPGLRSKAKFIEFLESLEDYQKASKAYDDCDAKNPPCGDRTYLGDTLRAEEERIYYLFTEAVKEMLSG